MEPVERWKELNAQAIKLRRQGVFSKATELAEKALTYAESNFDANDAKISESLHNLALIHFAEGKYFKDLVADKTPPAEKFSSRPPHPDLPESPDREVLLNLVESKLAKAETLLKRALAIRQKILEPDDPVLSESLEDLSRVHKIREKLTGAGSPFTPSGLLGEPLEHNIQLTGKEVRSHSSIEASSPRRIVGLTYSPHKKFALSQLAEQDGQMGQESQTDIPWHVEDEDVAQIKSTKSFKEKENIDELDVAGNLKYKQLSHYLSIIEQMPFQIFKKNYPHGFLVERSQNILDRNAIFQYSTQRIEDRNILTQPGGNYVMAQVLELRVIELRKKNDNNQPHSIAIGRSANNDIVLYNKMISKQHACLNVSDDGEDICIFDLQSTNKTFLNNKELEPGKAYKLKNNDEISFGPETTVMYLSTKSFYQFLSTLSICAK